MPTFSTSLLTVVLAGDGRLPDLFRHEALVPEGSHIRVRFLLEQISHQDDGLGLWLLAQELHYHRCWRGERNVVSPSADDFAGNETHQPSLAVQERTSRIARRDGGIGLKHSRPCDLARLAVTRDDAPGYGPPHCDGMADHVHFTADSGEFGPLDRDRDPGGERSFYLKKGQILTSVRANDFSAEEPAVETLH